jgi:hypothetical protein
MVGGTALCFTSLVLAWQVIGRTLSRRLAPDEAPAFAKATAGKQ